jgi:hypothetical protein
MGNCGSGGKNKGRGGGGGSGGSGVVVKGANDPQQADVDQE